MKEKRPSGKDHATVKGEGQNGGPSNAMGERRDGTSRKSNSFRRVNA